MDIRARVDALVALLATVGISATPEAQDVAVPGAWIAARSLERVNRCLYALHVDVYLIVPDGGPLVALDNLGELLADALDVVTPSYEIDLATSVILPHDGTPLPAFRIPLELDN